MIQLGGLVQTSGAFNSVQTALSFFITVYRDLAEWRAVIARLDGFDHSIAVARAAATTTAAAGRHRSRTKPRPGSRSKDCRCGCRPALRSSPATTSSSRRASMPW